MMVVIWTADGQRSWRSRILEVVSRRFWLLLLDSILSIENYSLPYPNRLNIQVRTQEKYKHIKVIVSIGEGLNLTS